MDNNKIRASEWCKKAEHDIEAVKILIEKGGPSDVAGVLLQQGVEKYLKGYLISKGWKLRKIHDLKVLLDEATKYDPLFSQYYDLFDVLTQYYFEEKYPFGEIEASLEDIENGFEDIQELIDFIKGDLSRDG
ncbi:MAG: HEPN domain-containing protein [bacterium]